MAFSGGVIFRFRSYGKVAVRMECSEVRSWLELTVRATSSICLVWPQLRTSGRDVRFRTVFFRFAPRFGRGGCYLWTGSYDPERTFKARELVGRLSLIVVLHLCGCASPERSRYSATAQRIHDYIAWSSG